MSAEKPEQNARVMGAWSMLSVDTTLDVSGCQVVSRDFFPAETPWAACGLPAFVRVYGGEYDDVKHEDVQPRLCYRHLHALGDTGDLIVRPA